jgi:hypothetical protein
VKDLLYRQKRPTIQAKETCRSCAGFQLGSTSTSLLAQKKDKNIRLVPVEAFHQISAFIGRYAAVEPHVLVPATPPKSAQESPAQIHRKNHEPGQAEIDIHGHTFIMYDDIIKYNVFAYTFDM